MKRKLISAPGFERAVHLDHNDAVRISLLQQPRRSARAVRVDDEDSLKSIGNIPGMTGGGRSQVLIPFLDNPKSIVQKDRPESPSIAAPKPSAPMARPPPSRQSDEDGEQEEEEQEAEETTPKPPIEDPFAALRYAK